VLGAAQARLFFFDFADLAVDLVARGFWQGVEEFLEALGLAEFAGEGGVDGHGDLRDFSGREFLPQSTRREHNGNVLGLPVRNLPMHVEFEKTGREHGPNGSSVV
jgi:hypothetical protein